MKREGFGDRLIMVRKALGFRFASEFANACEISQQNLSSWESGGSLPSLEKLSKIYAHFPEINKQWLEEDIGEMFGKGRMVVAPKVDVTASPALETVLITQETLTQLESRVEEQASTIERQEKMIEWLKERLEKAEERAAKSEHNLERISQERNDMWHFIVENNLVKKFLASMKTASDANNTQLLVSDSASPVYAKRA